MFILVAIIKLAAK